MILTIILFIVQNIKGKYKYRVDKTKDYSEVYILNGYRNNNNVGYKKTFPMSYVDDDSFCHYCGRKANFTLQLEWDHVPALNVKIPEDCTNLRKTLIRACKECNSMANDTPHMDFLERHIWLKSAYLRRYKKLLVNEGYGKIDKSIHGFLLAYANNVDVQFETILNAIGFGISNIDQIESPILQIRIKSNKKIEHLLISYLYGGPLKEEEEEQKEVFVEKSKIIEDVNPLSLNEFTDFLVDEYHTGNTIKTFSDYKKWYKQYPGRASLLELPKKPQLEIKCKWDEIYTNLMGKIAEARKIEIAETYEITTPLKVKIAEERKIKHAKALDAKDCSYRKFIAIIYDKFYYIKFESESSYKHWIKINNLLALDYLLPPNPTSYYKKSWSNILIDINNYTKVSKKCFSF